MSAVAEHVAAPVTVRDCLPSDRAYVAYSWRRSLIEHLPFVLGTRLARADMSVRVAADPSDPDVLLGFAIHTGRTLHWIYVRQALRKLGVARALLEGLDIDAYDIATEPFVRRLRPADRGWRFVTNGSV